MVVKDISSLAVREAPRPKARRVYKTVSLEEKAGAFVVLLDGKPVKTPARAVLSTKRRALAEAVAVEWDAQRPVIDPEAMPLTRLVSTALDRVAPHREALIAELMNYAHADLLCYRAAYPADLKARQDQAWQPVLDWLKETRGVSLTAVAGLMPHRQTADTVDALRRAIAELDDDHLTALQATAAITNSLALSLALTHGHVTPSQGFAAATLDESYQMERWGEDELALQRRRLIEADLLAIGAYLTLLKLP